MQIHLALRKDKNASIHGTVCVVVALNVANVTRLIVPTFAAMTLTSLPSGVLMYVKEWVVQVNPVLLTMTAAADYI